MIQIRFQNIAIKRLSHKTAEEDYEVDDNVKISLKEEGMGLANKKFVNERDEK